MSIMPSTDLYALLLGLAAVLRAITGLIKTWRSGQSRVSRRSE